MAGNHTSYLDPVVLVFPVRPWVRFLAKGELEKSFWGKRLFSALGIVPIDRGSGDLSAIERCAALTRDNKHLCHLTVASCKPLVIKVQQICTKSF